MNVEAFLISMNDPQLERCLESIKNQTVPFSKVTHINGVSPMCDAWNKGWEMITEDWVLLLNGDEIIYPDGLETALNYMKKRMYDGIAAYCLGWYNPFLEVVDNQFSIVRSSVYKKIKAVDSIVFDRIISKEVRRQGWRYKKRLSLICGTHFEDPTEYQVFTRFSRLPQKYSQSDVNENKERLSNLFDKTGNDLYAVALDAIEYGIQKKNYPGSYRIEFDDKAFEEFNAHRG